MEEMILINNSNSNIIEKKRVEIINFPFELSQINLDKIKNRLILI